MQVCRELQGGGEHPLTLHLQSPGPELPGSLSTGSPSTLAMRAHSVPKCSPGPAQASPATCLSLSLWAQTLDPIVPSAQVLHSLTFDHEVSGGCNCAPGHTWQAGPDSTVCPSRSRPVLKTLMQNSLAPTAPMWRWREKLWPSVPQLQEGSPSQPEGRGASSLAWLLGLWLPPFPELRVPREPCRLHQFPQAHTARPHRTPTRPPPAHPPGLWTGRQGGSIQKGKFVFRVWSGSGIGSGKITQSPHNQRETDVPCLMKKLRHRQLTPRGSPGEQA